MDKIIILKILLTFFIGTTSIFAGILLTQDKPFKCPGVVPVPIQVITGERISTTTNITIQTSPYTKINSVYAEKDGKIYYAEPFKRHTKNPVYFEVKGADPETFVIEENYSTQLGFAYDKNNIFFDGKMIDVDKSSFEKIGDIYFKDKNYIYRIERDKSIYSFIKTIYDIPTFRIFTTGSLYNDYVIDKNGVYYAGEKIIGVDPNTLAVVSSPAEIGEMNGKSSPTLSRFYMRDSNNVIYEGKIIPDIDVNSFKPIFTGPYIQEYAKDKNNVYYLNSKITGADPKTFIVKTHQIYEGCRLGMYSIDNNAVYYKDMKVIGADPNTFESLYGEYGKDKNNIYLKGVLQENLDPETFTHECNYG